MAAKPAPVKIPVITKGKRTQYDWAAVKQSTAKGTKFGLAKDGKTKVYQHKYVKKTKKGGK